jgi:ribosomal protein S18 acetylase RimI-like enzyme
MTKTTPPPEIQVRKIVEQDIPAIKQMLARAFEDDPYMAWLIPQDKGRTERAQRLFGVFLQPLTMPGGLVYTTPERSGAALWRSPQPTHTIDTKTLLRTLLDMVRVSGVRHFWSKSKAGSAIESLRPKRPHYYLYALGVEPALQGRGIGSALMQPVLQICDAEQAPAYLETYTELGLRFYQNHGFQVHQVFQVPQGGPQGWAMWREPAGS